MSMTETAFDVLFSPASPAARLVKNIASVVSWLWTWKRNRNAIKHLTEMEDWQLYDIGLKRSDLHVPANSRYFDDPTEQLRKISRRRSNHI